MKFLVTNDDGIDAAGLKALEEVLRPLGELLVIAPDRHLSGCSHQATTDRGMSLLEHAEGRHALEGTPVDCTRIGLIHLGAEIDWVVSGINEGGNLGADVYHSGTVAAVREAALLGKPGIAVSQYRRRREPIDWQRAARWTSAVITQLLTEHLAPGRFFNVNLPDALDQPEQPEVIFCPVDPHPLPVGYQLEDGKLRYRGVYSDRARRLEHDVDHCFKGRITVSELSLFGTDTAAVRGKR